ncbi:hypothetical protein Tco_1051798 [Tanacetum coccineum]
MKNGEAWSRFSLISHLNKVLTMHSCGLYGTWSDKGGFCFKNPSKSRKNTHAGAHGSGDLVVPLCSYRARYGYRPARGVRMRFRSGRLKLPILASLSADSSSDHAAPDLVIERTPTLIDSGALLLQSLLIDNQEKKRRSTYSTTAFRRSNEEKNFSVRREAECSVIEAEDKEKGEREAILIVLVPPKGSVLDLVVKNLTETIFFALRNRSN